LIFVALGTQDLPFNRLLRAMDDLVASGAVSEPVFAQTGFSDYAPVHYSYNNMMPFDDFARKLQECDIFVSHGGTGSLVQGLKLGKRVVAAARLRKYGEHVDDHQQEIIRVFSDAGLLIPVYEMEELGAAIERARTFAPKPFETRRGELFALLERFIEGEPGEKGGKTQ
jgi:UDP-N-acetylglucosamine transferase subunit ALG13